MPDLISYTDGVTCLRLLMGSCVSGYWRGHMSQVTGDAFLHAQFN